MLNLQNYFFLFKNSSEVCPNKKSNKNEIYGLQYVLYDVENSAEISIA